MFLKNAFDSHVHLQATGQIRSSVDLSRMTSVRDFAVLQVRPQDRRGEWIVGFGWDENKWAEKRVPSRLDLDAVWPSVPVYFSRCDGHSGLANSVALRALGLADDPACASGLLREAAHYRALTLLPAPTPVDLRGWLLEGARVFNRAGFTHVRDMAGNIGLWRISLALEAEGLQTLHVDWNFPCENLKDFERALNEALACSKEQSALNKVAGVKLYFDGSLGSETAYLSRPYANRTDGHCGETCWPLDDLETVIRRTWAAGLPVAIHAIGDEAADIVVTIARKVSAAGFSGRLNLEHAQVLRPETIQKMKPLHVTCHMQPCHWLSDRGWLNEKLGSLSAYAFPWEALRRVKIPFFFGSDSPIEEPSLANNLRALRESALAGIPELGEDPLRFHVHPLTDTAAGETLLEGDLVREVRLQGQVVYQR